MSFLNRSLKEEGVADKRRRGSTRYTKAKQRRGVWARESRRAEVLRDRMWRETPKGRRALRRGKLFTKRRKRTIRARRT
jgi:hypothetical protein